MSFEPPRVNTKIPAAIAAVAIIAINAFLFTTKVKSGGNKRIRLDLSRCASGESAFYANAASFNEYKCILAGRT